MRHHGAPAVGQGIRRKCDQTCLAACPHVEEEGPADGQAMIAAPACVFAQVGLTRGMRRRQWLQSDNTALEPGILQGKDIYGSVAKICRTVM
eukprot:360591-Chlamydomonas_euryale.AAC.22